MSESEVDILFDVFKSSLLKGSLPSPTATNKLDNPLCGDSAKFDLTIDESKIIQEVRFEAEGCFICRASSAVLADVAQGKNTETIGEIIRIFRTEFVDDGKLAQSQEELKPLFALRAYPGRVKCVMLPFEVLAGMIKG